MGAAGGENGASMDLASVERLLVLEPGATLVLANISLTGVWWTSLAAGTQLAPIPRALMRFARLLRAACKAHRRPAMCTHSQPAALLLCRVWPHPRGE